MESNSRPRDLKGKSIVAFPNEFVVIDIETTGLYPAVDSIIELAALKVNNGVVIDTFQELVNPGFEISDFIEDLTGITNDMLCDAKSIDVALPHFLDFLGEDSIIVGHNVNFDINFIYDAKIKQFNRPLSNDYIDTLRIARRLLRNIKHHRLCDLIEYFDIEINTQHRALADCLSAMKILDCLKLTAEDKFGSVEEFIKCTKAKNNSGWSVDISKISASVTEFDESHPLYDKHCCFTGVLEKYTRVQAAQIVVNFGGFCDNTVTQKTNFLVLGNNDYCTLIKDGKSSKQKKAEELILRGYDLTILPEIVFYEMIGLEEC